MPVILKSQWVWWTSLILHFFLLSYIFLSPLFVFFWGNIAYLFFWTLLISTWHFLWKKTPNNKYEKKLLWYAHISTLLYVVVVFNLGKITTTAFLWIEKILNIEPEAMRKSLYFAKALLFINTAISHVRLFINPSNLVERFKKKT